MRQKIYAKIGYSSFMYILCKMGAHANFCAGEKSVR